MINYFSDKIKGNHLTFIYTKIMKSYYEKSKKKCD